ncbi:MAG: DUF2207 domain-containing protein [Xanthobacteraceae bacterium]
MARIRLAGAIFAALFVATGPAHAIERILRFVSDVKVERNGDLTVTESIRVQAEGREIRRGILRDFPTTYTRSDGSRVEVGFDVGSVTRDGNPENFTTERMSNGVRVRIGSADRYITTGPHDYIITYRTTRQIGFFADFDELYWNVTGTGWIFPIDVAEASIDLPESVPFRQTALYTGPQGARGTDARIIAQTNGHIIFRTTRPLAAGEGLTIAAAWQKGVIDQPTQAQLGAQWMRDNAPIVVAGIGLLLLIAYYIVAWVKVGRDPPTGTIIPLFGPPDNMSAAAVRFVRNMSSDNRGFTAAIIDSAVRGHLKIGMNGKDRMLTHLTGGQLLPPAEQAMMLKLFAASPTTLLLAQVNHGILERATDALNKQLKQMYQGRLFLTHAAWAWWGLLIAALILLATAFAAATTLRGDQTGAIVFGMLFCVPLGIYLTVAFSGQFSGGWLQQIMTYVFGALFTCIFAIVGLSTVLQSVPSFADALTVATPIVLLPLAGSAFSWAKAHTIEGRKVTDQIDGFREYLGVAEEARLEALNPPEKTPELFEKFLPYAIALDVENTWAERFAGVLAAAAAAGAATATWYSGNYNVSQDTNSFVSDLGSSLSQTIASASTAPGSGGGGSGGGGSSGGGGGGGGGSGW